MSVEAAEVGVVCARFCAFIVLPRLVKRQYRWNLENVLVKLL